MLNSNVKTSRVINATAAGTSAVNGTAVDMTGFDSVRFTALFGTLTSTQVTSLKAQQGDASNGSDAVDITGAVTSAMADGDSNKICILDVHKSLITKRYVRLVVVRGTANAVVDGAIADQYRAKALPPTADTTVSQQASVA